MSVDGRGLRQVHPALVAEEIFTGGLGAPMPAAVKAARQVLRGEAPDDELQHTETALATSFALAHADRLRYDWRRRVWMVFANGIWREDRSAEAQRLMQSWSETYVFELVAAATTSRDVQALRLAGRRALTVRTQRALLEQAAIQTPVATDGRGWNLDPRLLATLDGTAIDLRTGHARPAAPSDYLTLSCGVPYDPDATCPTFDAFCLSISDDDTEQARLLQLLAGYCATGATNEQIFAILIGSGSNGKSTLLEVMRYVLGDYAVTIPFSVLVRDRDVRSIPVEIAQLPDRRFCCASELRGGATLDEGRVKALSGDDTLMARGLYQAPFEFRSVAKLVLACNQLPAVADNSHAFWRRALVIPFRRTFDGASRDNLLSEKLRAEGSGILNWLIAGAIGWHAQGLPKIATVEAARSDWRTSQDVIGQWADVSLRADQDARLKASDAYHAFRAWATTEGLSDRERPGSRTFGEWMAATFTRVKTKNGMVYLAALVQGEGFKPVPVNPHTRTQGRDNADTVHTLHPSPTTSVGTTPKGMNR